MNKLITRRNNVILIGFKATSQFLSGSHLPTRLMHKRTIPKRLWGRGRDTEGRRQGCCPLGAIDFWRVGEVYLITSSILVVTALGGPCCRLLSYESRPFHPFHPSKTRTHLVSFPAAPSPSSTSVSPLFGELIWKGRANNWVKSVPFAPTFCILPCLVFATKFSGTGRRRGDGNRWPPIIGRLANHVAKNYCTVSKNKRYRGDGRYRRARDFTMFVQRLNQRVNRFAWFPLDIRLFNARVSKSLSWNTISPMIWNFIEILLKIRSTICTTIE